MISFFKHFYVYKDDVGRYIVCSSRLDNDDNFLTLICEFKEDI